MTKALNADDTRRAALDAPILCRPLFTIAAAGIFAFAWLVALALTLAFLPNESHALISIVRLMIWGSFGFIVCPVVFAFALIARARREPHRKLADLLLYGAVVTAILVALVFGIPLLLSK